MIFKPTRGARSRSRNYHTTSKTKCCVFGVCLGMLGKYMVVLFVVVRLFFSWVCVWLYAYCSGTLCGELLPPPPPHIPTITHAGLPSLPLACATADTCVLPPPTPTPPCRGTNEAGALILGVAPAGVDVPDATPPPPPPLVTVNPPPPAAAGAVDGFGGVTPPLGVAWCVVGVGCALGRTNT